MKRDRLQKLQVRCRCGRLRPPDEPVCPDCYHRRRKESPPRRPEDRQPHDP